MGPGWVRVILNIPSLGSGRVSKGRVTGSFRVIKDSFTHYLIPAFCVNLFGLFSDLSLSICNYSKKNIENKAILIPEDCYHRMKWRKPINLTTLEENKKFLESIGVTKYNNFSIKHSKVAKTVKLVILVIIRWNDKHKRIFFRNTLRSFGKGKKKL